MSGAHTGNPATAETVNGAPKWREQYKVHPAADVFPMMSDEELAELGKDIKANGLKHPIILLHTADTTREEVLLDGRNRLEAMERAGLLGGYIDKHYRQGDPVAHIIGLNIRRRHLTKQQQADLIVAAIRAGEKLDQVEPVSKGGRGKVNKVKAKALEIAAAADISEATVKRAIAKAELTLEEWRAKYEEQRQTLDARARARREDKEEKKRQRESDVEAALIILDALDLDTAQRLVTLLMDDGTCCDVSTALVCKENARDDENAKGESDFDAIISEVIGIDITESNTKPPRKNCRQCHGAGTVIGKTGTPFDCDCVKR